MSRIVRLLLLLPLLALAGALVPPPTARAANYVVTNLADSGAGSLRQAILDANATAEADTITFNLTGCPCTIPLTSGQFTITEAMTIDGPGADVLVLDAGYNSRVFQVTDAVTTTPVVIEDLTIDRGAAVPTSPGGPLGGGILNLGKLTLTDSAVTRGAMVPDSNDDGGGGVYNAGEMTITGSTISENLAPFANGAGIFNAASSSLTITDSTVSANHADQRGGGVFNAGSLTVTDSAISGNDAVTAGGGIGNMGGTVTIADSDITDNDGGDGGGIATEGGTVTITNSTLSGNRTNNNGGGISNLYGELTITDSTLSGNMAVDDGDHSAEIGGGIANFQGTVTLTASTLDGNSAAAAGGGISNWGSLGVTASTLSNNSAPVGGGIESISGAVAITDSAIRDNVADYGGGISDVSALTITRSTINGNTAQAGDGGGIVSSDLTMTNSTVANNTASGNGGGVSNRGTATITHSTLANNSAGAGGGNVFNSSFATLTLASSIVAFGGCVKGNVLIDGGYNVSYPAGDCPGINLDPQFDPAGLADNGGPTQTIDLRLGSPAIGLVPPGVNGCGTAITTDQRGIARPQAGACDAGAVESPYERDTEQPTITPPGNVTAIATSSSGAVVTYPLPDVSDNVPGVTVSCSQESGSSFPIGETTVICTAIDTTGNTGTASFTVTVVDATAPVITVPADITVNATGPTGAVVNYSASATDAIDGTIPVNCVPPSGSIFPVGTTTVTCTATDAASNSAHASFAVTVIGAGDQLDELYKLVQVTPIAGDASTAASVRRNLLSMVSLAQTFEASGDDSVSCLMLSRLELEVRSQVSKRRISARDAEILWAKIDEVQTALGCGGPGT